MSVEAENYADSLDYEQLRDFVLGGIKKVSEYRVQAASLDRKANEQAYLIAGYGDLLAEDEEWLVTVPDGVNVISQTDAKPRKTTEFRARHITFPKSGLEFKNSKGERIAVNGQDFDIDIVKKAEQ